MFTQNQVIKLSIFIFMLTQFEFNYCLSINTHTHSEKSTQSLSSNNWMSSTGRRLKRNLKEELGFNPLFYNLNKDEFNALTDFIQENPWAIFTYIPEVQKRQMNYTPRLGRGIGDDINTPVNPVNSERWTETEVDGPTVVSVRSPLYTPRLGKRFGKYL